MPNSPNPLLATVHLPLGDRSYDIIIKGGLLDELETHLKPLLKANRVFVITETTVAGLYESKVAAALARGGITAHWFHLTPGEATKSFAVYEKLLNDLLACKIERSDVILALGGGVIGDLAGFVAASLLRGIDFIQIPTTLLSQVDSSVGGKTGINTAHGKNLVGAFHQPLGVLIDPYVLKTLPVRELQAGYAEVLKYGLIDDPTFFGWLLENGKTMFDTSSNRQLAVQTEAIKVSCEAKARVVAEDERESGKRALLNLGHTFGHALEAECGYDGTLLHGEGVAIGMVMALDLSVRLGLANPDERDMLINHLKSVGMKWSAADIGVPLDAGKLLSHMAKDKKAKAGSVGFILGGIGKAAMHRGIDLDLVQAVLHDSVCGTVTQ
ncbi:3-dehydroquinate synthase [Kordiimonas pumila]|uniref:3-dehydroquinate synthase n=1 Tax=Kordiimonas pumila TaxID=2161677 RepID=A0ABV7D0R5_9PROT|nr:3-dehydroquinate synthase [Kordiimonas pumila]